VRKRARNLRVDSQHGVVLSRWFHNNEFGRRSVSIYCMDVREPDRLHKLEMSVSTAANLAARLLEHVRTADAEEEAIRG
jgi:hypothetical protein